MGRERWPGELGAFLRARRESLDPSAVGVVVERGRRVAGLRRSEVAARAAISLDYYTRIEQGRIAVSEPVLEAVAKALRLTDGERHYAATLAGHSGPRAPGRVPPVASAALVRLLDDLGLFPAVVLGPGTEVIAWNAQAAALFTDFGALPPHERSLVRLVFLDPDIRARHLDWPQAARQQVAALRYDSACRPDDPALLATIAELRERDVDFRRWWDEHRVEGRPGGPTGYRHDHAGELWLDRDVLVRPDDPTQKLLTLTAPPGSPSAAGLRRLQRVSAEGG
ncbi:helix-turn-helix domain-containing protein [Actinokineospora bangkokensis]|uniref:helix-turn-helix domain-containing protein n=1 Tax=Actinokineospora bangkokensis TaxID=1193682 RepID=UPI000A8E2068|nr:helix-turn-helix transcriptional regulator [Actinokineospora bangkokensis]